MNNRIGIAALAFPDLGVVLQVNWLLRIVAERSQSYTRGNEARPRNSPAFTEGILETGEAFPLMH